MPVARAAPSVAPDPIDLPHFQAPFAFTTHGQAVVVEQDTLVEVESCVANIAACPAGYLTSQPEFGVPDPTFQTLPIDPRRIEQAIVRSEPRAQVQVTVADPASSDQPWNATVTIDVQIAEQG